MASVPPAASPTISGTTIGNTGPWGGQQAILCSPLTRRTRARAIAGHPSHAGPPLLLVTLPVGVRSAVQDRMLSESGSAFVPFSYTRHCCSLPSLLRLCLPFAGSSSDCPYNGQERRLVTIVQIESGNPLRPVRCPGMAGCAN